MGGISQVLNYFTFRSQDRNHFKIYDPVEGMLLCKILNPPQGGFSILHNSIDKIERRSGGNCTMTYMLPDHVKASEDQGTEEKRAINACL